MQELDALELNSVLEAAVKLDPQGPTRKRCAFLHGYCRITG